MAQQRTLFGREAREGIQHRGAVHVGRRGVKAHQRRPVGEEFLRQGQQPGAEPFVAVKEELRQLLRAGIGLQQTVFLPLQQEFRALPLLIRGGEIVFDEELHRLRNFFTDGEGVDSPQRAFTDFGIGMGAEGAERGQSADAALPRGGVKHGVGKRVRVRRFKEEHDGPRAGGAVYIRGGHAFRDVRRAQQLAPAHAIFLSRR